MDVAELRVGAVEYSVGNELVSALWYGPDGSRQREAIGPTRTLLTRVEELRDELRDTTAVARGRVPRLRAFAEGWGRDLLPPQLLAELPDVVVVVPHSFLHSVPLHLARTEPAGEALGAAVGLCYTSSRSLFVRCARRNPARSAPEVRPRSLIGGGADVLTGENEVFHELARSLAAFFDDELVTLFADRWPYSRAAVKAAFRREAVDVLCVVAHGYTDPVNQRMSGLLTELDTGGLTSRAIPLHGGRYFDFRDLPLRRVPGTVRTTSPAEVLTCAELEVDGAIETQLVVLLACATGAGRVLQGDEPASLAESFLHIGAPSIVAPMWDSDYEPTREWMRSFCEGWVELGYPKALAARHAIRTMDEGPYADRPERLGALALRGDWL